MKSTEYLARVREKLNLKTDYQVAKALKVRPSLGYKYISGKVIPGPLVAFTVAEILGDQPAAVIADFEAERAERMGKEEDVEEWKGILQKIAASILLALGLGHFPSADARLAHSAQVENLRIGSKPKRKRRARPFDGLMSLALA